MDRLTAFFMMVMALVIVGAVAYMAVLQPAAAPAGPNTITVQPAKVTTDHWKVRVYLKEGVGPNTGEYIDGTVKAYLSEIKDVYDIPSDAIVASEQNTTNGSALFDIAVDPDLMTDSGMPVYFVAEADGYYKNSAKVVVPKEAIPDEIDREHAITIKLDKVGTMGWTADDAYRGADSPVLRYKSADEIYKSIFAVKPQIDFETDKPSGVFVVKKVYVEKDANTDYSNVDSISVKIGDVAFDSLSVSDLPKSQKLDQPMEITADQPVNVEVTVNTVDGTASLSSGTVIVKIKFEDVLGNTYEVPVKVA